MNYSTFNRQTNLKFLLQALDILESRHVIIKLNTFPDYDISKYHGLSTAEYFFRNSWKYNHLFDEVCEASFALNRVFHEDHIREMRMEYRFSFDFADFTSFLQAVHDRNPEAFVQHGFDAGELDEFNLKRLRLSSIDSIKREIFYEGVFLGDSSMIDPIGWSVYSLISVTGIKSFSDKVYNALIAESYMLFYKGDFKLSYFLAYTALENFVNSSLGKVEDEGRLKDNLNELFASRFNDLGTHQIYSSVTTIFGSLTMKRNWIAHG